MFKQDKEGVVISLFIQANAPKSEIIGEYNQLLKVKIKSPPVDGKANEEIIRFFSELFHIAKNKIEILTGDKSKQKKILIRGLSLLQIQEVVRTTSKQ